MMDNQHQLEITMPMRPTQLHFGRTTVELQNQLAILISIGVDTMSVETGLLSGEPLSNKKCIQALTRSP
jgi:hypothetical protein